MQFVEQYLHVEVLALHDRDVGLTGELPGVLHRLLQGAEHLVEVFLGALTLSLVDDFLSDTTQFAFSPVRLGWVRLEISLGSFKLEFSLGLFMIEIRKVLRNTFNEFGSFHQDTI